DGLKVALLHECLERAQLLDSAQLAAGIKALPIRLHGTRPLDEAISSAGGIARQALDDQLMLRRLPGVFCAGEMLDWEAPTGGYRRTAGVARGLGAGRGALAWLKARGGAGAPLTGPGVRAPRHPRPGDTATGHAAGSAGPARIRSSAAPDGSRPSAVDAPARHRQTALRPRPDAVRALRGR